MAGRSGNDDFHRILGLEVQNEEPLYPSLQKALARPGGQMQLWPAQLKMLSSAYVNGGLLASAPVGSGKELTALLLPLVLKSERPMLIVPSSTVAQVQSDYRSYGQHFRMHPALSVMSYEQLSSQRKWENLERYNPDLVILNESHLLKTVGAARTMRFAGFMRTHFETKVCSMTGTPLSASISDLMLLSNWALKLKSPCPIALLERERWARILDQDEPERLDVRYFEPLAEKHGVTTPREAFAAQLRSTAGVILLAPPPIDVELRSVQIDLKPPARIAALLEDESALSATLGDDVAKDENTRTIKRRQLVQGFFYRYSAKTNPYWFRARSAWFKECRIFLGEHRRKGLDTPGLIASKIKKGGAKAAVKEGMPASLLDAWRQWEEIRPVKPPPKVARWLSEYLVDDVIARCMRCPFPIIIWYEHRAMAIRLHKKTGWRVLSSGDKHAAALTSYRGRNPVIASRNAFGKGLNLQHFGAMIFTGPISDAAALEQALGRIHRSGQLRKVVLAYFYSHFAFEAALEAALSTAKLISLITDQRQKILQLFDEKKGLSAGEVEENDEESDK